MDAAPLLRNSASIVREDSGRKLKRLEHFERGDTATAILKKTKYQVGRSVETYDEKERAGVQRAIEAEKRKNRYAVSRERMFDNRMYIYDDDAISMAKNTIDKVVENERLRKVRLKLKEQEASAAVAAPIGEDIPEKEEQEMGNGDKENTKAIKEDTPVKSEDSTKAKSDSSQQQQELHSGLQDDLHTAPARFTFEFRKATFPERGTRGSVSASIEPPRQAESNEIVNRLHKLASDATHPLPLELLNSLPISSLSSSDLSRVFWCVVKTNTSPLWKKGFNDLINALDGVVEDLSSKDAGRTLLGASQLRLPIGPLDTNPLVALIGALLCRVALEESIGHREALTGSSACVALCAVSKLIATTSDRPPSTWLDLHETVESLAGRLTGDGIPFLNSKEICVALSSMATSGVLHRVATATMLDQLLSDIRALRPTQLVGLMWALSKMNITISGSVMMETIWPAIGDLSKLSSREVASLLHSLGKCIKDQQVAVDLRKELSKHITATELNGNEICAVIEGLGKSEVDGDQVVEEVLQRLSAIKQTLSPSQIGRCLVAIRKLPKPSYEVHRELMELAEERLYAFKPQQYVTLLSDRNLIDVSSMSIFKKAKEHASSLSLGDLLKLLSLSPGDSLIERTIDDKVTEDYRFKRPNGASLASSYLETFGHNKGHVIRKQIPALVKMCRTSNELHWLLYAIGVLSNIDTMDHLHTHRGAQAIDAVVVDRIGVDEDPVGLLEALSFVKMDPTRSISALMTSLKSVWADLEAADRERALAAAVDLGIDTTVMSIEMPTTLAGVWANMVIKPDVCVAKSVLSSLTKELPSPQDRDRLEQILINTGGATSKERAFESNKYSRWISDALSYLRIPHQPDSVHLNGTCSILAALPTYGIGLLLDDSTYPGGRPTGRSLIRRRQLTDSTLLQQYSAIGEGQPEEASSMNDDDDAPIPVDYEICNTSNDHVSDKTCF
ncbi:hypothetical protein FOL47_004292 [Perkinsus chesapeaki]|uniref:Uncharacterized protein n=1 Tax=Perkinsus chesapeaki TaxID=330153 RepID=A0A7J6M3H0_PERCH|nr:hypothetical protein FOL47_004292 [Perkinsus chesapeaki]